MKRVRTEECEGRDTEAARRQTEADEEIERLRAELREKDAALRSRASDLEEAVSALRAYEKFWDDVTDEIDEFDRFMDSRARRICRELMKRFPDAKLPHIPTKEERKEWLDDIESDVGGPVEGRKDAAIELFTTGATMYRDGITDELLEKCHSLMAFYEYKCRMEDGAEWESFREPDAPTMSDVQEVLYEHVTRKAGVWYKHPLAKSLEDVDMTWLLPDAMDTCISYLDGTDVDVHVEELDALEKFDAEFRAYAAAPLSYEGEWKPTLDALVKASPLGAFVLSVCVQRFVPDARERLRVANASPDDTPSK